MLSLTDCHPTRLTSSFMTTSWAPFFWLWKILLRVANSAKAVFAERRSFNTIILAACNESRRGVKRCLCSNKKMTMVFSSYAIASLWVDVSKKGDNNHYNTERVIPNYDLWNFGDASSLLYFGTQKAIRIIIVIMIMIMTITRTVKNHNNSFWAL